MLLMILKNSRIQPDKQNRTVIAASLSLFFFSHLDDEKAMKPKVLSHSR